MSPETAQTVALQALDFIAGDEDNLGAFMARTGLSPDELRRSLADPSFLGGVLDFLLEDDAAIVAFCQAQNLAPEVPLQARASLPGAAPDW